jgi:hypothetical protein
MRVLTQIGNRIKMTYRDLRAAAAGIRLATRDGWPNSAHEFVQALLCRYAGRLERRLGLSLVFRQRQPGGALHATYPQTQIHLAPRLVLTVLAAAATPNQPRPRLQVVVRGERIEPGAEARQPAATHPAWQPPVQPDLGRSGPPGLAPARIPPIRRVVRRAIAGTTPNGQPPIAATATDTQPSTIETATAVSGSRPAVTSKTGQAASGPIDVNRLTEQVIQAIDHRIIAQRERLGRV